jgi:VIT1/CCC1 family predicted Fe2+/Mn2+ transporter
MTGPLDHWRDEKRSALLHRVLAEVPKEESAELALIHAARGAPRQRGSPGGAASFSFGSFAVGASNPLAPFLFLVGSPALLLAIGLAAPSLFTVGATLSSFTGRRALWGGPRMLLLGGAAGAATFGIGRLRGASLS